MAMVNEMIQADERLFYDLVSIAQTLLRARGEWQAGATSWLDIELACNQAADLIRGDDNPDRVSLGMIHSAIAELKLRAGNDS